MAQIYFEARFTLFCKNHEFFELKSTVKIINSETHYGVHKNEINHKLICG